MLLHKLNKLQYCYCCKGICTLELCNLIVFCEYKVALLERYQQIHHSYQNAMYALLISIMILGIILSTF